jgi:AmmeMemoRadiSam system protein A
MLTPAERRALLELARAAVTARVAGGPPPDLSAEALPEVRAGAFVSLHRDRELRGCIGHIEADRPLAEVVARVAVSAATEDPRFPPVTPAELPLVDIEISVLGPLERIDPTDPKQIEVGRHGLLIDHQGRRGLLLPQVATEWGWDRETFLEHLCAKAGLPRDAWRRGALVYRFEAEVFSEASEGVGAADAS